MDASAFNFVKPKTFRANIVESVEFVAWLWILAHEIEEKYQDEMVRIVILYNMSIVEALLLFWAKKHKKKFFEDRYINKYTLPRVFQGVADKELLLAHFSKTEKGDTRIWFHELIAESKQLLGKALHTRVVDLQDIRNTFHLSKRRQVLSLKKAESSFDVVYEVVDKIRRDLRKIQAA